MRNPNYKDFDQSYTDPSYSDDSLELDLKTEGDQVNSIFEDERFSFPTSKKIIHL